MTASGVSLIDANVWLALAVDAHLHHEPARTWFDSQPDESCVFCRITQLALLRHLTNSKIMGTSNVQTQQQAWRSYEAFAADPRVVYRDEPVGLSTSFQSLTQSSFPAHKQWTDAYLAAFAECHSMEIVTFDAGFKSFAGLRVQLLHSTP